MSISSSTCARGAVTGPEMLRAWKPEVDIGPEPGRVCSPEVDIGPEPVVVRRSGKMPLSPVSWAVSRSASSTSSIDWKRATGSFWRQRMTTASTSGGTSVVGLVSRSGRGASFMCWKMTSR